MKRIIFGALLCTLLLNAQAQTAYEIKFKVDGLKDSVCYLFRYHWESHVIVDTAKIRKGNFVFAGKEPLEKGIYFLVRQNKTMLGLDFLVDSMQKFSIAVDTVNLYRKMKIAGSPLNENFKDFV